MDEAFWYVQIPFRLCHCGRSSCGRGYCGQGFVPASYVQGVVRGGVFTAYLVLFVVCLGAFSAETTQQRARLAGISGECMMELSESVTRGVHLPLRASSALCTPRDLLYPQGPDGGTTWPP